MSPSQRSWYPLFIISIIILLDSAGYGVIVPIIPDFVSRMNLSPIQVSSLYSLYGVVLLIFPIPFGIIADRIDRKTFLYLGLFCKAAALYGITLADSYMGLLAARTVDAIAGSATWTVGLAMIADFYPQETIGSKFGIAVAAGEGGSVGGPLLSGPLADYFNDIRPPFYLMSALCALSVVLVVFMPKPRKTSSSRSLLQDIKTLLSRREIIVIGLIFLVVASFIGMIEPLYPVYLRNELGFTRTLINIAFGTLTGAFVIMMPPIGMLSDKIRPRKLIITGLAISALMAPGLVIFKEMIPLFFCLSVLGISWALLIAPAFPLFTRSVKTVKIQFGISFGLFNAFWAGGFIVGPAIGGPLAQFFGILTPLIVFSIIMLTVLFVLMGKNFKID